MTRKRRPIAFVAMKFECEHWRDKRYIAISEELDRAGFLALRADQVKSSGPVVDEVCRLLQEAALVVIDSTGDSHSVSYEIGYCHGARRPADTTLLLRMDADTLPFNYQHYRHRIYNDIRALRRLIRDYLGMSEPLSGSQDGYTFTFDFSAGSFDYMRNGAFCIFDALRDMKFSGRCECYVGDHLNVRDRLFSVGIMLRRSGRKAKPDYKWWMKLKAAVARHAKKHKDSISLDPDLSEFNEKRAMLSVFVPSGIAQFSDGLPTQLLGSDEETFLRFYYESLKQTG